MSYTLIFLYVLEGTICGFYFFTVNPDSSLNPNKYQGGTIPVSEICPFLTNIKHLRLINDYSKHYFETSKAIPLLVNKRIIPHTHKSGTLPVSNICPLWTHHKHLRLISNDSINYFTISKVMPALVTTPLAVTCKLTIVPSIFFSPVYNIVNLLI
jgi:hypothetical protein